MKILAVIGGFALAMAAPALIPIALGFAVMYVFWRGLTSIFGRRTR